MDKDGEIRGSDGVTVETDFTLQAIGEKVSLAGWLEGLIGLVLALHKRTEQLNQNDTRGLV